MAIADLEFKVVPKETRDSLKRVSGNRYTNRVNPLIEALVKGETIIVDVEESRKIAGLYESARKRGYKLTANKVFQPDAKGNPTDKPGYLLFFTEEPKGA